MRMSFAQRGMYLEMLLEQWEHYSLPDDPAAVAEIIGGLVEEWTAAWPTLRRKFVDRRALPRDGACDPALKRIVNLKLESIRGSLRRFKKVASVGGKKRASSAKRGKDGTYSPAGHPAGNPAGSPAGHPAGAQTSIQPVSSTPTASPSPTPIASASPSAKQGGTPPLALGLRRFKVWRWMLDDLIGRLGSHADDFDIEGWLMNLDRHDSGVLIGDPWLWLQGEFSAEVQRRGLPIDAPVQAGKQTTKLADALAQIRREARG